MDHGANSRPISHSEGAFADQDWEGIASVVSQMGTWELVENGAYARGCVSVRSRIALDEAELVRTIRLRLLIAKFAARCAGGALCPIEEKSK